MPEKPQEKKYSGEEIEKSAAEEPDATGDESAWSSDQEKRGYYYDDACGYEIYQPDEENEED